MESLVQQVHDSFNREGLKNLDQISDSLRGHLQREKELSTEEFEDEELLSELMGLGFHNSKSVVDGMSIVSNNRKNVQKNSDLVDFYETLSLFALQKRKIISYNQLTEICNKWGLYLADVENFTGTIPKASAEAMLNYKPVGKHKKVKLRFTTAKIEVILWLLQVGNKHMRVHLIC